MERRVACRRGQVHAGPRGLSSWAWLLSQRPWGPSEGPQEGGLQPSVRTTSTAGRSWAVCGERDGAGEKERERRWAVCTQTGACRHEPSSQMSALRTTADRTTAGAIWRISARTRGSGLPVRGDTGHVGICGGTQRRSREATAHCPGPRNTSRAGPGSTAPMPAASSAPCPAPCRRAPGAVTEGSATQAPASQVGALD